MAACHVTHALMILAVLCAVVASTAGVAKSTAAPAEQKKPVAKAASPVAKATKPVAKATKPVAKATTPVAKATKPVAKATTPVAKASVAAAQQKSSKAATTAKATDLAKPRRLCVFPFWWRRRWQHTCVQYTDRRHTWCSLTANFTRDEMWRECESHDQHRFGCHLPFEYSGRQHTRCLPLGQLANGAGYWCGVVKTVAKVTWSGTDWALCENENATTKTYLLAVGGHKDLAEARRAAEARAKAAKVSGEEEATESASAKAAAAAAAAGGRGGEEEEEAPAASQAALAIVVATVCSVLAVAAVIVAYAMRRRHQYKRLDPLLNPESERGYGGVQEYHD